VTVDLYLQQINILTMRYKNIWWWCAVWYL